jgi:peroxiredoxin
MKRIRVVGICCLTNQLRSLACRTQLVWLFLRIVAAIALCDLGWQSPVIFAGSSIIGRRVENFTLKDCYGNSHSLADYRSQKLVVLTFLGTECPLAQIYADQLSKLYSLYRPKAVLFLGIDSNRQDDVVKIANWSRLHRIGFPILKDLHNRLADRLGASRTPETFVLDGDRVIRYHGRIDNRFGIGRYRVRGSHLYLQAAMDDLLAGRAITNVETDAIGCLIGRTRRPDFSSSVTYSKQVVRLLNTRCVICHRAGEFAPFSLTSFDEASGWADAIAEAVRTHRMPPWHADPKYGSFVNNRELRDDEKETLYQWAAAGAPLGDLQDIPSPPEFVDGWKLPTAPDAVYYMADRPSRIPAEGPVNYQYFVVDPNFQQGKWLKAIEARPGNRAIVHHVTVFAQRKGNLDERKRQFLVGYAPGQQPVVFAKGLAKYIPAGSELLFQLHYTPNGRPQEDLSKVGFLFANPGEVTHLVRSLVAVNLGFTIPRGAANYAVEADSFTYPFDMQLVQMTPHMHLRGRSFRYEARYPNGRSEVLLNVPRYDFGWQTVYEVAGLKQLPKGTLLHCTAVFDNSDQNDNNPNPKVDVRWGDQTSDEMMIGFYDVAVKISQCDIRNKKLPTFAPTPTQVAARLLQWFDANHDGRLSQHEIPWTPFDRKLFFLALDTNHDGIISLDEILRGFNQWARDEGD